MKNVDSGRIDGLGSVTSNEFGAKASDRETEAKGTGKRLLSSEKLAALKAKKLKLKLLKLKMTKNKNINLETKPIMRPLKRPRPSHKASTIFQESNTDESEPHIPSLDNFKRRFIQPEVKSPTKSSNDEPDTFESYMQELNPDSEKPASLQNTGEILENDDGGRVSILESFVAQQPLPKPQPKKLAIAESKRTHSSFPYFCIKKDLYLPGPSFQCIPKETMRGLRKLEEVRVKAANPYAPSMCPIEEWVDLGLSSSVVSILEANKWTSPLAVQKQCLPVLMGGHDTVTIARTGSGKTLGYVLAMIRHVMTPYMPTRVSEGADTEEARKYDGTGIRAMVLLPSRELCVQIEDILARFKDIVHTVLCSGGVDIYDQIRVLKRQKQPDILVGTPGRVIELLCLNSGRVLYTRNVSFVVLDEADRMFDKGFLPQVESILSTIRPDRQICMFSATLSDEIQPFVVSMLRHLPVQIDVGRRSSISPLVQQVVEIVSPHDKLVLLLRYLGKLFQNLLKIHLDQKIPEFNLCTSKCLIFVSEQDTCDHLLKQLLAHGYDALSLHSGNTHADRTDVLDRFKHDADCQVLVATGVAARGLDVSRLDLVVNYNVPSHYEELVHRVGRTGRGKRRGLAVTFLSPEEEQYSPDLVKAMSQGIGSGLEQQNEETFQLLQDMSKEFKQKVRKGEAFFRSSGFKTASDRDTQQILLKTKQKGARKQLGLDENDEEDKSEEEGEVEEVKAKPVKKSARQRAREMAEKISSAESGAHGDGIVESSREMAVGAQLKNVKVFSKVIDINDLDPKVRFKLTFRTTLEPVASRTECEIQTRGQYQQKPKPGAQRLHLYLEGSSRSTVLKAEREIAAIVQEEEENVAQHQF